MQQQKGSPRRFAGYWALSRQESQDGELSIELGEYSAELLSTQELIPRARTIARAFAGALPESGVNVYLLAPIEGVDFWVTKASAGEASVQTAPLPAEGGTLGEVLAEKVILMISGPELVRERYAHLDVRRTLVALTYIPLVFGEMLIGAIELLGFGTAFTEDQIDDLILAAHVGASALGAAQRYESERNDQLGSIGRLSQLYDLEKVFSSTLEMDELLHIIALKIREVMECQGVNIWMMQPDESVELMQQAGFDPSVVHGSLQKPGGGVAGDVSDNGEPLLIAEATDNRLVLRNREVESGKIFSLIGVPIIDKESLVGVIEAVNKADGQPFDDDDLFALSSLADTASRALHNASLLLAERKVEILETLVTVSREITSTLNLERMLQTIVNAPQAVIPYERAAIALDQRGRFKLSAVTGVAQLNADAPEIAPLDRILQWAGLAEEVLHVRQHDGVVEAAREETRAKFEKYFSETGMRGFYAVPLNDDTGRVGVFCLESSDPDFLSPAHLEILEVLTGQATVALRNAQMYKEVPFITLLEPVLERKRKFMAMEKRRRALIVGASAAAIIFLAIVPLPLRVDGDAVVAPAHKVQVQTEIEGVVNKVFVREGEQVKKGQPLAELDAWNYRSALAEAEAKYQTASLQVNRSLAGNDNGEAGVQRVQADYWKTEVDRAKELLDRAQLRAPIDGVVSTPSVENSVGKRLQHGDSFAEVMDASDAVVDVGVDDADAGILKAGQHAVVKLNSYATQTFRGDVSVVSPKGETQRESRVFFARVALPNPDGVIRAGMEGRGKVTVGWYPAGYVIFRKPLLWAYAKVWDWFGW